MIDILAKGYLMALCLAPVIALLYAVTAELFAPHPPRDWQVVTLGVVIAVIYALGAVLVVVL